MQTALRISELASRQQTSTSRTATQDSTLGGTTLAETTRSEVASALTDYALVDIDSSKANWIDAYLLQRLEQQADELQCIQDARQSSSTDSRVDLVEPTSFNPNLGRTSIDSSVRLEPLLPLPTSPLWNVGFHAVNMEHSLDRLIEIIKRRVPTIAITANLNYVMLCDRHPRLRELTRRAGLVLCDGMPIYWRSLFCKEKLPGRVAGSDLIYRLSERCADQGLSVYFYGAAPGVAQQTADRLKTLYPKLRIAGVQCPPFHSTSVGEQEASLHSIRSAKPDVLFVALGQPKGEYWIEDHLDQLSVPLCIQVGASFDFVAGNCNRAPIMMQLMGLEWLYRLINDPKRLGPRYLQNAWFLAKMIRKELIESLS